jgi:hypothetical protein
MLNWFTTIPGLLITCGIILLIIAVVLYVLGNKKEKTSGNVAMNSEMVNQQLTTDEVTTVEPTPVVLDTPIEEVKIEEPEISEPNVIDQEPVTTPVTEFDFSIPNAIPAEEIKVETPEVTIYGGNSPLENTEVEPVTNHEPYAGVSEVVEPKVESVIEQPVAMPTIDIPAMNTDNNKEEL